jgi:cell wall-associated NlpC family hydrolase
MRACMQRQHGHAPMLQRLAALCLVALLSNPVFARTPEQGTTAPAHGVIGVEAQHLAPDYWIDRLAPAGALLLDAAAIAVQNARMLQSDRHVQDPSALPSHMEGRQVRDTIASLSAPPARTLYDDQGAVIVKDRLDTLIVNTDLDTIPASVATRPALVVRRADLRTFPTHLRAFSTPDDTDIDRFQESALFPGTPVVITHTSADGAWQFVISALYSAWIERDAVAEGPHDVVFGYGKASPSLVVTGATVHTVYNPEEPGLSALQLDMGVRVPVLADWPADKPVNGQHPYTSHVIQLPVRRADGALALLPALLPRTADVAPDYLPYTSANLLRQSFKFLGERYGWGHRYDSRDCSGFVSEVYRSMGIVLPRNTSAQAVSPALERIGFEAGDSHEKRLAVLRTLQVGDLVYIPGHVMMVIGHDNGTTYTIHDTTGITYRGADGKVVRTTLNSVAVTPLEPLLFNSEQSTVDRITAIQRVRPQGAP